MECFVCNQSAEKRESVGDYVSLSCDNCGVFSLSGTVVILLQKGRWLNTEGSQQWLEEQRREGIDSPLITDSNAIWDGTWVKG